MPDGNAYQLKKSYYKLKQSTKQWNDMFVRFLTVEFGLTRLRSDECMSYKRPSSKFLLVAMYVDDIVVAFNCQSVFQSFRDKLF